MIKDISEISLNYLFRNVESVDFESVLDKEIIILDVLEKQGKFGSFVGIKYKEASSETPLSFVTGSKAIVDKALKLLELQALPVYAKVVKINNYYDLVSPKSK